MLLTESHLGGSNPSTTAIYVIMKIAVLVYGMYREFDIAVKSWEVLNNFDCDFYFSTWNKSKQVNKNLGYSREFNVDKNMILQHYPNAMIDILDEVNYIGLSNSGKMIFHWKNCLSLLNKSNKNYDYIILLRFDDYFESIVPSEMLSNLIKPNILYSTSILKYDDDRFFLSDIFLLGSYDMMKKLIDTVPIIHSDIHHYLGKHVHDLNLNVEMIRFLHINVIRPNVIEINDIEINHETIHKKRVEWNTTKNL